MKKAILDRLEGSEFGEKAKHEFESRLKIPLAEAGAIFQYAIQEFGGSGKLTECINFSILMPAAMMVVAKNKGIDPAIALKQEFIMEHLPSTEYRLATIKHSAWLLSEEIIAMQEMVSRGPYEDPDQVAIQELFSWFTDGMPTFSNSERRKKFWHDEFYGDVQSILEKAKVATRGGAIMLKQKVDGEPINRVENAWLEDMCIINLDSSLELGRATKYSPPEQFVPQHRVPTLKALCAMRYSICLALSIDGDLDRQDWLRPSEDWHSIFGSDFD